MFLGQSNLVILLWLWRKDISGESDIKQDTKEPLSQYKTFLGIVSVASPDAQAQDYKCLDGYDDIESIYFFSLFIKKKREKVALESIPDSYNPVITDGYYFGTQYYLSAHECSIYLKELKIIKQERKVPVILY